MFKINKLTVSMLFSGLMIGSYASASPTGDVIEKPITAPAMSVGIQAEYRPASGTRNEVDVWAHMATKYLSSIESYNHDPRAETGYPGFEKLASHDVNEIYNNAGTRVKYSDGQLHGVFSNKWYIQGEKPAFDTSTGVWELVVRTNEDGEYLSEVDTLLEWNAETAYVGGSKVKHEISGKEYIFEARIWIQAEAPILLGIDDQEWMSSWKKIGEITDDANKPNPDEEITKPPVPPVIPVVPIEPSIPVVPVTPLEPTTPVVPVTPLEPSVPVVPDVTPPPPTIPDLDDDNVSTEDYAFLRELTEENWDWLFPLRSGKYQPNGDVRNTPPFANPDGTTDVFTLTAFKDAVYEYNTWATKNGYKTFLNEGTKSQQALEFVSFWAKSARETSGTWENAPSPWIENDRDAGTVWKGGLYWIEEMGRSTDANGVSSSSEYVDANSAYTPEPGRSYYGRGVIQLSWNYNYGAFSYWLYDNGMMRDVITERGLLLKRPDLVATNGKLSVMSGIWFWMTPQGTKPSSHDVMLGDVTNVSQSSQELGLPPRNDGGVVKTSTGESNDQHVIAYRLGTVINIVNGGLECNSKSSWHDGPMHRVSYYNAFAKYMNANVQDIKVPVIDAAVNVWTSNVTDSSDEALKAATCYVQKSYYSW